MTERRNDIFTNPGLRGVSLHGPRSFQFPGLLIALCLIALCLAGCGDAGDGLARLPLSGQVKFDGRSDLSGRIRFAPAKGATGPVASTEVKDGGYQFTRDNGPVAGAHQVVLELAVEDPSAESNPAASGPKGGWVSPYRTIIRDAVLTEAVTTVNFDLSAADGAR